SAERPARYSRVTRGLSAGSGAAGYWARLTGTGKPAGSVAVRVAHSPPASVVAVTVAVSPFAPREVTTPASRTSSPAWMGLRNRAFAVPRSSQAAPNASASGWVR